MSGFLAFLMTIILIVFFIGMVKPELVIRHSSKNRRLKILAICFGLLAISEILNVSYVDYREMKAEDVIKAEQQKEDKQKAAEAVAEQKRADDERKAQEEKAKQEAQKPPVALSNLVLDRNSIGEPRIGLAVTNTSNKIIDAFKIRVYAHDNFGKQVEAFGYGSGYFSGISQETISQGKSTSPSYKWTMHGFENGTKFKLQLMEVHFSDGTGWKTDDNQDVSISGELEGH